MTDHEKLRELAEAAPAGKWEIWTSCSWRRIYANDCGQRTKVIEPCVQRHDNHPDLTFGPGVAQFIECAGNPETILALLDEIEGNKKLIRMLQEELFFWMPSIAGEDGPDGERAADDAMLLLGFEVGDGQDCYGDRMLRLNAEWMAKCEELRRFVAEIAEGRIDPDKIAAKARKLVAKKEGA